MVLEYQIETGLRQVYYSHRLPGNKGGSHKHHGNHELERTLNGRTVTINKDLKPKGISLTQWMIEEYKLSHKQASKLAKEFH